MSYDDRVAALADDPEQLEKLYQAAQKSGEVDAFRRAIEATQTAAPDNLLYKAWFYRLKYAAAEVKGTFVRWAWVVPLALLNGLLFWWLSDDTRYMIDIVGSGPALITDFIPAILLLAGPIAAIFVLAYLVIAGRRDWRLAALIGLVLSAAAVYVIWAYPRLGTRPFQEQYLNLMAMHLPLLAWAGVGLFLTSGHRNPENRFAFLIKSLEVFIMGGLLVIAGGLLTAITAGLFSALDIELPQPVIRLFIAGGGGLIPVVASAVIYNAGLSPAEQSFDEGLSKLVALLMRIMLPLTLLVLAIYTAFIPFNFREPFDNRDVLIIFNAMLFAVAALLVGATPIRLNDVSPEIARWLRRGILAVATLALIVAVYALAAIVYRTAIDRLTPNRLTFIGWNVINVGLLVLLLALQTRNKGTNWSHRLHRAFSAGAAVYAVWSLVMVLALPWVFKVDRSAIEALPTVVQGIVFQYPDPILLKCTGSPHIYLLEQGEKRWINTIETFEGRGYVWRDVHFVPCDALRSIPDGETIPADAGPPPQP